jgi:transcriptional regulator with XRE-family HTH domain
MSLRSLAALTGFSPSFISQVENGIVSPSINSMQKISEALGVTLSEFFAAASHRPGGMIVRAAEREMLSSSWSRATVESLAPMDGRHPLDAVLITLEGGGRSGKHPYPRSQAEFSLVLDGEVSLSLGPDTFVMEAGDAAMILPRELRLWVNEESAPARILVVSVRARPGRLPGTTRPRRRAR